MKILGMINSGGFAAYVLLACSIVSLAVIINKIMFYRMKSRVSLDEFLEKVEKFFSKGDVQGVIRFCDSTPSIFSNITKIAIARSNEKIEDLLKFLDREVGRNVKELEKYTIVVGTIANISVYIGLLGTIIGIMQAFGNIATQGMGGIDVVIGGVSKALITTAFGLIVSIPAVIAYNYFMKKIDDATTEMELYIEELLVVIGKK